MFLENDLEVLLEEFPPDEIENMWIQLDGAPAHYEKYVRAFLNKNYPNKWIG